MGRNRNSKPIRWWWGILACLSAIAIHSAAFGQGLQGAAAVLENGLSTTVKTVKASPGRVAFVDCINPSNAAAYVQIFDVAAGTTVILGTTVPKASIGLQTLTARNAALNINMLLGIKAAATTTAAGLTAPSTALDCTFGIY